MMALLQLSYLSILVGDLFGLHGFLPLVRLLHFHQRGAGHAEDAVNVYSHLDFHFGALSRCLWDNLLDQILT